MKPKLNFLVEKPKAQHPKGTVLFKYYITGEGNKCKALFGPERYAKNGEVTFIGRSGGFDHFLATMPGENPCHFLGTLF